MFTLNMYTGKKKQNFRNHIVLQMTIILENRGKTTEDVRRKFYNTNSEKRWASVACNTHKIIHCTVDSNILPRCVS